MDLTRADFTASQWRRLASNNRRLIIAFERGIDDPSLVEDDPEYTGVTAAGSGEASAADVADAPSLAADDPNGIHTGPAEIVVGAVAPAGVAVGPSVPSRLTDASAGDSAGLPGRAGRPRARSVRTG